MKQQEKVINQTLLISTDFILYRSDGWSTAAEKKPGRFSIWALSRHLLGTFLYTGRYNFITKKNHFAGALRNELGDADPILSWARSFFITQDLLENKLYAVILNDGCETDYPEYNFYLVLDHATPKSPPQLYV